MNCSAIARCSLLSVVFALWPLVTYAQPTAPPVVQPTKGSELRLFDFSGGTPAEFLTAVDKTFGVEWSPIAAIPEKARAARIPAMRMRVATAEEALNVSNKLTIDNPNLGLWTVLPGQGTVSAILYTVRRSSSSSSPLEVQAISLRDVPSAKWNELLRLLDESLTQVLPASASEGGTSSSPVNIRLHNSTGMLMISATKEYIERIESLALALRAGMAEPPGSSETSSAFVASKLVPLTGVALDNAKALEAVLAKATDAWLSAQEEQGAKGASRGRFSLLPDLGGLLLVGPREWIDFAGQVAAQWVTRRADNEEAALAQNLKARAFSIAGLSPKTVEQIVEEVRSRSAMLRDMQQKLAAETGRVPGGGVVIYGSPQAVSELQVLLVTGNEAGLEFARSFIDETKAGIAKAEGTLKYVSVGGAVRTPQRIVWTEDLTALGAISAVGGLLDFAKDTIRLIRGQETRTLSRKAMINDPKKDQSLQPGDRLEVEQ